MTYSFQWMRLSGILLLVTFCLNGCGGDNVPVVSLTVHSASGEEIDSTRIYIEEERNRMSIAFKRFFTDALDDEELVEGIQLTISSDLGETYRTVYQLKKSNGKMALFQKNASGLSPALSGFKAKGRRSFKNEFVKAISEVMAYDLDGFYRKMKKAQKAA